MDGKSAVMGETPLLEEYDFNDTKYDYVIIGTPVWASTFTPPIRTFINDNKDKLQHKKIAVFLCCSGGSSKSTIDKLKKYLDINDFEAELVLIDPKEKESDENLNKILEFCSKISK